MADDPVRGLFLALAGDVIAACHECEIHKIDEPELEQRIKSLADEAHSSLVRMLVPQNTF